MPFFLLSRIIHYFLKWPRLTVFLALIATIILAPPIYQMRWSLTLPDLLSPETISRSTAIQVEEKFGGFGSLQVIISSPDSARNKAVVERLAHELSEHPLINFVEYKTAADFFSEYQFLYIDLHDLQQIRDRIYSTIKNQKIAKNPLIVSLAEPEVIPESSLDLNDLRTKYLKDLKTYYGNDDKTILQVEIFPNFPITDLNSNRRLVKQVQKILTPLLHDSQEVNYAGKVFVNASTGGMLLQEIYRLAWVAVLIIVLFSFFWFIHTPQIALVSVIPVAMAIVWTLGINGIIYGHSNLFTLLLGLILPGLGGAQIFHFMTRYSEERRQGLGVELALESTLLGLGPIITLTSLISALAFFALSLIPLAGIKQLGVVAGLGVIFTWLAIFFVFPALLLWLQKRRPFTVFGPKMVHSLRPPRNRVAPYRALFLIIVALTLILGARGFFPDFNYDFSQTEYSANTERAKTLQRASDLPTEEPLVALTNNASDAQQFVQAVNFIKKNSPRPTIDKVWTFSSLLPNHQTEKITLIKDIKSMLTPEILSYLQGTDSSNAHYVLQYLDVPLLTVSDLPYSYQRKFAVNNSAYGEFTFIYPAVNTDDGRECRQLARDLRSVQINDSTAIHTTGAAIMRADILDSTLPWLNQVFFAIIAGIFLLLIIYFNNFYDALMVMLPPAVGFLWLLSLMKLLNISLNPYSAQVFPMLVGLSVTGSLHLWHSFKENSWGNLRYIYRNTGRAVLGGTANIIICFSALVFSSHPGLRSMGIVAIMGMVVIILAQLLNFLFLAGITQRHFKLQAENNP